MNVSYESEKKSKDADMETIDTTDFPSEIDLDAPQVRGLMRKKNVDVTKSVPDFDAKMRKQERTEM